MLQYQNNALSFLDDLIYKLFTKEYFGFIESSEDYTDKIVDFMDENIERFPSRKTPTKLKYFGNYYIFYKINPRTTWFIFFEKDGDDFLITRIINNHCEEAKYL